MPSPDLTVFISSHPTICPFKPNNGNKIINFVGACPERFGNTSSAFPLIAVKRSGHGDDTYYTPSREKDQGENRFFTDGKRTPACSGKGTSAFSLFTVTEWRPLYDRRRRHPLVAGKSEGACNGERKLIRSSSCNHSRYSLSENLYVQPQRPVLYVLKIHFHPFVKVRNICATVYLPQARNSRFNT